MGPGPMGWAHGAHGLGLVFGPIFISGPISGPIFGPIFMGPFSGPFFMGPIPGPLYPGWAGPIVSYCVLLCPFIFLREW